MADLTIDLDTLIDTGKAALIGNTTAPMSLPVGDPLLALVQSNALVDLLVAQNIKILLSLLRASTSVGPDLDSWLADFGFVRLIATKASGVGTFRINATGANIPAGTLITSSKNSATYIVVADGGNAHWVQANNRYEFGVMSSTFEGDVAIEATAAGSAYNVGANTLTAIPIAITNVTAVTNKKTIQNGRDREVDADALLRFQLFLQSLGKANEFAIASAIQSVLGAQADFVLLELVDEFGNARSNYFTVVAENGSGSLSPSEIAALTQAVDLVRGFPIGFDVTTPQLALVGVAVDVVFDDALLTAKPAALAEVQSAVGQAVNAKRIGETLYYSEIVNAIMRLRPHFPIIRAVEKVTINSGENVDFAVAPTTIVRLGGLTVRSVSARFAIPNFNRLNFVRSRTGVQNFRRS